MIIIPSCAAKIVGCYSGWTTRWARLALITGCFDCLHPGHVDLISQAKIRFPDLAIGVAINSDESIRALKGIERPIFDQYTRARMLASLDAVDVVMWFHQSTAERVIDWTAPKVWIKGGDYTLAKLDKGERQACKNRNTKIVIIPRTNPSSTSDLAKKIMKL